jgi:hypothetical protein
VDVDDADLQKRQESPDAPELWPQAHARKGFASAADPTPSIRLTSSLSPFTSSHAAQPVFPPLICMWGHNMRLDWGAHIMIICSSNARLSDGAQTNESPERAYAANIDSTPQRSDLHERDINIPCARAACKRRRERFVRAAHQRDRLNPLLPAALAHIERCALLHRRNAEPRAAGRACRRSRAALALRDRARDASADLQLRDVDRVCVERAARRSACVRWVVGAAEEREVRRGSVES